MRDDFDPRTKDALARRVGMKCSAPHCQRATVGPQDLPTGTVNVGVAAHITAASFGGPRYDTTLTPEQRQSIENGIWLCQTCAKLVDNDVSRYPVELLCKWKQDAERAATAAILGLPSGQRTLTVRVSSTRDRRRQMAHFQLYNCGPGPFYIAAWYISWGEGVGAGAWQSIGCERGRLPIRLQEHDAGEFLVALDDVDVESIREIGVVDGERQRWPADPETVKGFIRTAMRHRPPPSTKALPDKEALKACNVAMSVYQHSRPGTFDQLEIVFRNDSDLAIPLSSVLVEWTYDPPRGGASVPGQPSVAEVSGSVKLGLGAKGNMVQPHSEARFHLADEMAGILVAVLADDVPPANIVVGVVTTTGLGWSESGHEVAETIRAVARSVVASWDA